MAMIIFIKLYTDRSLEDHSGVDVDAFIDRSIYWSKHLLISWLRLLIMT